MIGQRSKKRRNDSVNGPTTKPKPKISTIINSKTEVELGTTKTKAEAAININSGPKEEPATTSNSETVKAESEGRCTAL